MNSLRRGAASASGARQEAAMSPPAKTPLSTMAKLFRKTQGMEGAAAPLLRLLVYLVGGDWNMTGL